MVSHFRPPRRILRVYLAGSPNDCRLYLQTKHRCFEKATKCLFLQTLLNRSVYIFDVGLFQNPASHFMYFCPSVMVYLDGGINGTHYLYGILCWNKLFSQSEPAIKILKSYTMPLPRMHIK